MSAPTKLAHLHHRMPAVFGPFPGPRQSFAGNRRDGSESTSVEAFITFKTTRQAVAELLPPGFSFQEASEAAFVSLAPKRLDNLEWLGGRGYNLYSMYIHGVQYTASDGKVYRGTFLPVLWEDMADPIISGREELGFPKLFSDISITRTQNSYSMTASWQGSRFAEFDLRHLREADDGVATLAPPEAGIDEGLLLYRCMPTVGKPGFAEAEYGVFIAYAEEKKIQQVRLVRKLVTADVGFRWYPLDWQDLPTLHHIVSRLADIPVVSIIAGGVTEKLGGADLSSARRISNQESPSPRL